MSSQVRFDAGQEVDTQRLGTALARVLPDNSVVGLIGTLGAGKTFLVQAVARSSGVSNQEVNSPTFVLIHEYHGDRPIYHIDAYRLENADEFLDLGAEECFDAGGLTFVEWADRIPLGLPPDRIEIEIEVTGPTTRSFVVKDRSACSPEIAQRLEAELGAT